MLEDAAREIQECYLALSSIGDLGTSGSVRSDGSGPVCEGRVQRSEGPAGAGRLAASPVSEPLAGLKLSNVA